MPFRTTIAWCRGEPGSWCARIGQALSVGPQLYRYCHEERSLVNLSGGVGTVGIELTFIVVAGAACADCRHQPRYRNQSRAGFRAMCFVSDKAVEGREAV